MKTKGRRTGKVGVVVEGGTKTKVQSVARNDIASTKLEVTSVRNGRQSSSVSKSE
jgi:hypothetical protein